MSTDDLVTLVGFLRMVIGLAVVSTVVWFALHRRRLHGGRDGRDRSVQPRRHRRHSESSGGNAVNSDSRRLRPFAIGAQGGTIKPGRDVP